jgi:hypothetical protein
MIENPLRCSDCESNTTYGAAGGMTYTIRCNSCGSDLVFTSLVAALRADDDRIVEARIERGVDRAAAARALEPLWGLATKEIMERDPLIRGPVRQARDAIFKVVNAGVQLALNWPPPRQ